VTRSRGISGACRELYSCVGQAFEVRFGCIQIHQALVKIFGFGSGDIQGSSYTSIDGAERRLQFLGRAPSYSPAAAVANDAHNAVRLERRDFSVESVFDLCLERAETVDGSILLHLAQFDVTDDFDHRVFKWRIDGVVNIDACL
jgi:hypothetical protein